MERINLSVLRSVPIKQVTFSQLEDGCDGSGQISL